MGEHNTFPFSPCLCCVLSNLTLSGYGSQKEELLKEYLPLTKEKFLFVKKIYETKLKKKVKQINQLLSQITFDDEEITAMYQYAIQGGRRFRPLLALIGCKLVKGEEKKVLPAAIAVELLHKASLVHDDLVDDDTYRRNQITFHTKFGAKKAVIIGDLLTSLAFEHLMKLQSDFESGIVLKCYTLLSQTFNELSIGEMKDLCYEDRFDVTPEQALQMTEQKTAILIQNALKIGAILGRGTEHQIECISRYGHKVGLAFQLINDLNNFTGLELQTGRLQHTDIQWGKKNPILAYALHSLPSDYRMKLIEVLQKNPKEEADFQCIMSLLSKSDTIQFVEEQIDSLLYEAQNILVDLPGSPTKQLLIKLTQEAKEQWFWIKSDS